MTRKFLHPDDEYYFQVSRVGQVKKYLDLNEKFEDRYLDVWFEISPDTYNTYYHNFKGVSGDMTDELAYKHPKLFLLIFDEVSMDF